MRPTRAALFVATTALAPALLLTAPAFAATPAAPAPPATARAASDTPVDQMTEAELRAAINDILANNSGVAVVREAEKALAGTVDDMRAFLKTGYQHARDEDDRVAVVTILAKANQAGDRAVIAGCQAALDDGSPEAIRAFLETGYAKAQAEDDLVAVATILAKANQAGDRAVIAGCQAALDDGTPEAVRAFRQTGYRLAQAEDDAVYIASMLADPDISDALRAAANAALDDGSPEALREFRLTGQYEVDE